MIIIEDIKSNNSFIIDLTVSKHCMVLRKLIKIDEYQRGAILNTNKQEYIKQHFIPETYLNSFAIDPTVKEGQIYIYDKLNDKYFINSIGDVMQQRFFYDIYFEELLELLPNISLEDQAVLPDRKIIEKTFSTIIEGVFAQVIDHIKTPEKHGWFSHTRIINRMLLNQLMTIQFIRTPRGKNMLAKIEQEILQKPDEFDNNMKNIILFKELINILMIYNMSNPNATEEDIEYHVDKYRSVYLEMFNVFNKVEIGVNKTDTPLIISDNPLIFINKKEGDFVYFPITPKHCILLKKVKMPPFHQLMFDEAEKYKKYNDSQCDINEALLIIQKSATIKYEELKRDLFKLSCDITENEVQIFNLASFSYAERFLASNIDLKKNINLFKDILSNCKEK